MTMSPEHRRRLAHLARIMIPGGNGQPSAADLDLQKGAVDEVLRIDPTRLEPMVRFLDMAIAPETLADIEALADRESEGFQALSVVLANAYFMHPDTRAAIGYPGQEARDSSVGLSDDDLGLLAPVIARGDVYRRV